MTGDLRSLPSALSCASPFLRTFLSPPSEFSLQVLGNGFSFPTIFVISPSPPRLRPVLGPPVFSALRSWRLSEEAPRSFRSVDSEDFESK